MKKYFILIYIISSTFVYSQDKERKFKIEYLNMTSLSVTKNTESYFSDFSSSESRDTNKGFGLDINTIHGAKFFGVVALSAGMGVDWNINKTFLSTPIIFDLRLFTREVNKNCLYGYLQTGKNIKWTDSFDGNGTSSKLGLGIIVSDEDDITYFVDIYKKSKQIEIADSLNKGFYNISGFGISIGVVF